MARFKPRERKHKVLQRTERHENIHKGCDSNTIEILPTSFDVSETNPQTTQHVSHTDRSTMSGSKRKRLDKYIVSVSLLPRSYVSTILRLGQESKMRKDRNMKLIMQLASARCDTSQLRSSKTLGSGNAPKRRRLGNVLRTLNMGLDVCNDLDDLYNETHVKSGNQPEYPATIRVEDKNLLSQNEYLSTSDREGSREPALNLFGTGLKQPPQIDEHGLPILSRRRRWTSRSNIVSSRGIESQHEAQGHGLSSADDDNRNNGNYSGNEYTSLATNEESIGLGTVRRYRTKNGKSLYDRSQSHEHKVSPTLSDYHEPFSVEMTRADREPELDEFNGSVSPPVLGISLQRSKSFTEWVLGETDCPVPALSSHKTRDITEKRNEATEKPESSQISRASGTTSRKIVNVHIQRSLEYQYSRLRLPVVAEEHAIMEAIHNNPVVIICGATGSGKTTQVPQFLYAAGYGLETTSTPGMIGITQPRRVAVVSSANRVKDEMGSSGSQVSYQIRFDNTVDDDTAIKYMTDGILVREATQDILLSKYSAIIIDEAHERSVNTDIMIGYLSRLVHFRSNRDNHYQKILPLKLIIMSATLKTSDFLADAKLFPGMVPPIIQVEGRQHAVTDHFARVTRRDYLEEAFQKVLKGHKKLPPGGMLVFLTGENEINALNARLHEALSVSIQRPAINVATSKQISPDPDDAGWGFEITRRMDDVQLDQLDDGEEDEDFPVGDDTQPSADVRILPLYSQLSTEAQLRVFEPLPENCRLIVLATNVAETSLTIPGIRYVFDSGRVKEKRYNPATGVQSFEINWISKASASQRAGRAGRTGPGHVYRLYSSAIYEQYFAEHAEPEILRTPIEGIVLQLKALGLRSIADFPFPTSPNLDSLLKAEKLLTYLKALATDGNVTSIGKYLARYPISPRFARMISLGYQNDCAHFTLSLVACLAVQELFAPSPGPSSDAGRDVLKKQNRERRYNFTKIDPRVDFCKAICAFEAYLYDLTWIIEPGDHAEVNTFCSNHGLRSKAFREVKQLYEQLSRVYQSIHGEFDTKESNPFHRAFLETKLPSTSQIDTLQQIVAAGYIDQIAIRADLSPHPPTLSKTPKRTTDVPYFTLFPSHEGRATSVMEKAVYIHPSSVLAKLRVTDLPHYIIYSHLKAAAGPTSKGASTYRVRMYPLTPINTRQIANIAKDTPLLHWSKPGFQENQVWDPSHRRTIQLVPNLVGEKGSSPWPLPRQAVRQILIDHEWVNVPENNLGPIEAKEHEVMAIQRAV